jgi:HD superfamily phosphohydrolase YqeK
VLFRSREIAKKDLDLALVLAMKSSIDYLIEKGIKPSIEQYEAFHYYEEVTRGKIK